MLFHILPGKGHDTPILLFPSKDIFFYNLVAVKSVIYDNPGNTVRNITFVKVPFSSFMDERNEDVLRT